MYIIYTYHEFISYFQFQSNIPVLWFPLFLMMYVINIFFPSGYLFSFIFGFSILTLLCIHMTFLCTYPAWSSLKLLDLWVDVLQQFLKILSPSVLEYFFCTIFPFLSFSFSFTHPLNHLILFCRSYGLCSFSSLILFILVSQPRNILLICIHVKGSFPLLYSVFY